MKKDARTDAEGRLSFSLTQLQAFSTVAGTLSYVDAAQLLGYSEPAVHYQVKRLEDALGCSLVFKSGRSLKLTAEGVRLLPQCIAVLREAKVLPHLALNHHERDMLSIAGGRVTAAYTLPEVIADVHRKIPSLHIGLKSEDRVTVVESVRNGSADLGISHSLDQVVDSDEFSLTRWRDIEFILLESSNRDSLGTQKLDDTTVYAVGQMNAPLSLLLSILFSVQITPHVIFLPSADAVKSMCIAGLGFGFLRGDCAVLEVFSGVLRPAPVIEEPIGSSVWAIQPKHRVPSVAATRFLELTALPSTRLTTPLRA